MSYESIHFIINPSSGGGNAGKIWAQARNYIEKNIGAFSFEYTAQKGHAIELAKRASEKAQKINPLISLPVNVYNLAEMITNHNILPPGN
jgi:diacylglycerol kinase family enzyme